MVVGKQTTGVIILSPSFSCFLNSCNCSSVALSGKVGSSALGAVGSAESEDPAVSSDVTGLTGF